MTAPYVVTIAKYGTRSTLRSDVYLNHHLYHEADGPIDMDYFFWVIRNDETTIVVDTGYSRQGGEARKRTTLMSPPELFAALGVDPATSPDIILTHAHYDHMGNLDHFPSSTIYMSRVEYEFWTGANAKQVLFHHSIEDSEMDGLAAAFAEGRVRFLDESPEIAPGIEVIEIGGHTPGQAIVKVDTAVGVVLLASDSAHYYEEYEADMPFMAVADLVRMYDGFALVREMVASGEVQHVVSGHDPSTLDRFTRVDGELHALVATVGEVR
ncbi:N-acyl homoserine lactonase family protein [Amnibacterium flavum]|uniref:N-acyl homoserine lactonase family protein n=1 Tax=Amnibacterium flavum TaxID=2173173 RepID=A0A2V1HNC2_9MICO|nr:N-acyl homoserine lactonase family protein [Amnibacterium flavum]PVZ93901.1 N-acyl homoserine lactonase family protein [Amnibacterium flavum]